MALAGSSLGAATGFTSSSPLSPSPGFRISASVAVEPSTSAPPTASYWHFPAVSLNQERQRRCWCQCCCGGNRGRLRFERNQEVRLRKERNFRDGVSGGFRVRARAEVGGRADEQADQGTGQLGAPDDGDGDDDGDANEGGGGGRSGAWSGEQDNEKAKALWESTIYPIMRVYRDDLCTLELTGDARSRQAIEAMGADGGFTAAEELSKGRPLMTVETIIPGRWEDHSTVSTKLLAPTHLVHRTARENWANRKVKLSSGNALARAFQRVVMQHVLAFDIHLHRPGVVRDMANLANEKEDAAVASLESRDATLLDGLAEALCLYSLANITDDFYQKMSDNRKPQKGFLFGRKSEWIWTLDKAVGVRPLSESEIAEHIKRASEKTSDVREVKRSTHQTWWPSVAPFLANDGSEEGLGTRRSFDFIPIHKLQIDTRKVRALAKGWQSTKIEQVLELDLTHSQMVGLADMLDLYYEDAYTAPVKRLRSGVHLQVSHHPQSKVTKMLWTALVSCIAGGVLLVALLVVSRLRRSSTSAFVLPGTPSASFSTSKPDVSFTNKWCRVKTNRQPRMPANEKIPQEEMDLLCFQVVNSVKEAFNLPGEVQSGSENGAWIGSDLSLSQLEHGPATTRSSSAAEITVDDAEGNGLQDGVVDEEEIDFDDKRRTVEAVDSENAPEASLSNSNSSGNSSSPLLLYQVVLSRNGEVLGFQPANKPAITRWVLFPFARELHKGRRLGSGLVERTVRYSELSEEAVVIELICNLDLSPPAVTARPLEL